MNKLLVKIGWKDYRGRWNRSEIILDSVVLGLMASVFVVVVVLV